MTVKQGEHNSSDSGSSSWVWDMHQLLWDRPDPLQTEKTQERGHVCSALGCICPWWTLTSARQTTLEAAALPLAQPEPISGWPVGFHRWQTAGGGRFPSRYFGDSMTGSHAVLTVASCINQPPPESAVLSRPCCPSSGCALWTSCSPNLCVGLKTQLCS